LFVRQTIEPIMLSPALREIQPKAEDYFKNTYSLEFLGLPAEHTEADLEAALLRNLGRFITELGRDFCFIGSQFPIQVGSQDFLIDMLFFHRGMNCLIAIELKIREFRPEDLGKSIFILRLWIAMCAKHMRIQRLGYSCAPPRIAKWWNIA